MFVESTFLSSFDRVSVKSTIFGHNGTFCGIIGFLGFLAAFVIIFYGTVINYSNGQYIQGSYTTQNKQNINLLTGRQLKISIEFHSKSDDSVVDHQKLKQYLNTRIVYVSPDNLNYFLNPNECSKEYFGQLAQLSNDIKSIDCYTMPNKISFQSSPLNGYKSLIGFSIQPVCNDPLTCISNSAIAKEKNDYRLNFFNYHYFIVRFTSSYIDQSGQLKFKFYQIYSSEWQSRQTLIPIVYIMQQTAKVYLDNSIMPWRNNKTLTYSQWLGQTDANLMSSSYIQNYGIGAYISNLPNQRIYVRQYKKADWLVGILGGGLFLLYIIFWTVCNYFATVKQKILVCQSTTLMRNDITNFSSINDSIKPTFYNPIWHLTHFLQIKICRKFKKQNKLLYCSQKFIDIVDLVKKLKISTKNLKKFGCEVTFEQRSLKFNNNKQKPVYTQQQKKLELKNQTVQYLKNDPQIYKIYNNNLPMLAIINNNNSEDLTIKMRMDKIMNYQKYCKFSYPKFGSQKSCFIQSCKKVFNYFVKFFTFFDVFGAKPNLCGKPQNFGFFGFIITSLIVIASILTFCLTLSNMSIHKFYFDNIYLKPQHQSVTIETGKNFKLAFCFPSTAFQNNQIVTADRLADLRFVQYYRNKSDVQEIYSRMIQVQLGGQDYFDITSPIYDQYDFSFCLKPWNNITAHIYGNSQTDQQAYIGVKLSTYCPGQPSQCDSLINTTNSNFWSFINSNTMTILYPQATYFPQENEVKINPVSTIFPKDSSMSKSIVQTIYLDTLHLINDYNSWVIGDFPKPYQQYLTSSVEKIPQKHLQSVQTISPQYLLKIKLSGKVSRVIKTSDKLDFLFGTIGGCFVAYYVIFASFGKAYNNYKIKCKLAQVLYGQETANKISEWKFFFRWIRFVCCRDKYLQKIQNDIQCVRLAKNVDSVYRLSVAKFNNPLQKDLGLIYLKQRIKEDESIQIKKKKQQQKVQDNQSQQNIDLNQLMGVQSQQFVQQKQTQIKQNQKNPNNTNQQDSTTEGFQVQRVDQHSPTAQQLQKCSSIVNQFDLFRNNAQFTIDGKRSVKSVCGGLCCIGLLIFVVLLVQHFLAIYFSQWYRVSYNKITDQNSENLKMKLTVGQNFKLALSFYQPTNFNFHDVANITDSVGFSLLKHRLQKINGVTLSTFQTIDLQKCKSDYLNKFLLTQDAKQYYSSIDKGYCVPDGTQLNLYGFASDSVRQYFTIRIYNKQGANSTSLSQVQYLLSNYLVRYHVSTSVVDLQANNQGQYFQTIDIIKSQSYQTTASRTYNTTVIKTKINYDTSINIKNQKASYFTYQIKQQSNSKQYVSNVDQLTDRYCDLNFHTEQLLHFYTIKTVKINQVFGIIGGCVALLFFGIGCIPRSFNQYKMRYVIGNKLYAIMGQKRKVRSKCVKGKPRKSKIIQKSDLGQFSQIRLLFAWFCSFIAFTLDNYNFNTSLRFVALLQNRVSRDINLYEFMKSLFACQSAIKQLNLTQQQQNKVNICRIFPKQIIPFSQSQQQQEQQQKLQKDLVQQIKHNNPDLLDAAKVNKFSYWQLKTILTGKQKQINFLRIFNQRWLDKFADVQRATTSGTRSVMQSQTNSSAFQSQSNAQSNSQSETHYRPSTSNSNKNFFDIYNQEQMQEKEKQIQKQKGKSNLVEIGQQQQKQNQQQLSRDQNELRNDKKKKANLNIRQLKQQDDTMINLYANQQQNVDNLNNEFLNNEQKQKQKGRNKRLIINQRQQQQIQEFKIANQYQIQIQHGNQLYLNRGEMPNQQQQQHQQLDDIQQKQIDIKKYENDRKQSQDLFEKGEQ